MGLLTEFYGNKGEGEKPGRGDVHVCVGECMCVCVCACVRKSLGTSICKVHLF